MSLHLKDERGNSQKNAGQWPNGGGQNILQNKHLWLVFISLIFLKLFRERNKEFQAEFIQLLFLLWRLLVLQKLHC